MRTNIVESESFHDNYIHGISFIDEDYASALVLDIDHIQEWHCSEHPFSFIVAPANLIFKNVRAMVIEISKPSHTINSYLGIILDISFEESSESRYKYEIEMVGGDHIRFEADESELNVVGEPVKTKNQYLSISQRHVSNKSPKPTR